MAALEKVDTSLTARSVVASTLLGADPPRLPVSFLVRTGEIFGFSEAAVRTALSRMVAKAEAVRDEAGRYELAGHLVARQERQREGRSAVTLTWDGTWTMYVVTRGRRASADRARLRLAMQRLRVAELREGVWLRPNNLPSQRLGLDREVVAEQCETFEVAGAGVAPDLPGRLWDLGGWSGRAVELVAAMGDLLGDLRAGEVAALRPGFVLSAAILRHFLSDPLLPEELQPADWPGAALRDFYEEYDDHYRALLTDWIHSGTDLVGAAAAATD